MTPADGTGRRCATTAWSRTAAVLVATMAGVLGASRLGTGGVPRYDAIIVGTAVALSLLAGLKMWRDNCFESRLAAVVVALLVATGQLLTMTVGGPVAPAGGLGTSYPTGLLVAALGALVPLGVAADARVRSRSVAEEPPYAL